MKSQELVFEYKDHFRNTLKSFGVQKLKHLTHDSKKKFFNHLKTTWAAKKGK
jgi:hypothetical protein